MACNATFEGIGQLNLKTQLVGSRDEPASAPKHLAAEKILKGGTEDQPPPGRLSQLPAVALMRLRNPLTLVKASAISWALEWVLATSTLVGLLCRVWRAIPCSASGREVIASACWSGSPAA